MATIRASGANGTHRQGLGLSGCAVRRPGAGAGARAGQLCHGKHPVQDPRVDALREKKVVSENPRFTEE